MKFRYMLDTNTISYLVNDTSPASRNEFRRLLKDPEAVLSISVITEAELRFGMEKRGLSARRRTGIEGLFANLEILPWGSAEAIVYAQMRAKLVAQGISVAMMDLLIAAHAAAAGAVLVTHDSIFARIASIAGMYATVDWAKDI